MKHGETLSVAQLIDMALNQTDKRPVFDGQQVCYLWPQIVGPSINRQTTRRWVDPATATMHVCISSAVLRNELGYMAASIMQRLNQAAGKEVIKRIIFH